MTNGSRESLVAIAGLHRRLLDAFEAGRALFRSTARRPIHASGRALVEFVVSHPVRAEVSVFDITGWKIRSLTRGMRLPSGDHGFTWDGRDDCGRASAPGVYHVTLSAQGTRLVRQVVLAR